MVAGKQHLTTFVLIAWRHDDHIRDAAQERQVKCPLVRLAVSTHNACAVDSKQDRQLLDGNVMDHLVVGALQEGGINGDNRVITANRQACREGHRVLLGNGNVKILVRVFFGELHHARTFTHGRGDRHELIVFSGGFTQPVAKDF